MNVRTPVNVGDGTSGSVLREWNRFLKRDVEVQVCFAAGDACFEARCATNSARNALMETTMTATAASACNQNTAHAASTWPLLMLPPATLMMEVRAVKMLRHKTPQSANLWRRVILTFQSNMIGMEMTTEFSG